MKISSFVCMLLLLPLAGTVPHAVPPPQAPSRDVQAGFEARRDGLRPQFEQFLNQFRAHEFAAAAETCTRGIEFSVSTQNHKFTARFLNGRGSCRFAMHAYDRALTDFRRARDEASAAGDFRTMIAADTNTSSLYWQLGDVPASLEAADAGLEASQRLNAPIYVAELQILRATALGERGENGAALGALEGAADAANQAGNLELYAIACDRMARQFMELKQLEQAEHSMVEAFRIRRFNRMPTVAASLRDLGLLRMEQRDIRSASALLDEAVAQSGDPKTLLPRWHVYQARAGLKIACGNPAAALADYRQALGIVRQWRSAAPAVDGTRVSIDAAVQDLYSGLIEAANAVHRAEGRDEYAREAFAVGEENRAASLRALLATGGDSATRLQARPDDLIRRTQNLLGRDAALLSFHAGEAHSYLWAISRDGFDVYRLAPRSQMSGTIRAFSAVVRNGSPDSERLGAEVYRLLFGQLAAKYASKAQWLIAPDEQLFEVPFAALVQPGPRGRHRYLIEDHALQLVSGARMLETKAPEHRTGPFLGIGDPIYNTADQRWRVRHASSRSFGFQLLASSEPDRGPGLPRLPGSGREIDACSKAWDAVHLRPILLTGESAATGPLERALDTGPSVIHFATHVLESEKGARQGVIALSLDRSGNAELLGPSEIARWRVGAELVSLSGCSSGSAEALPGAGLLGLTRAWIAAGAGSVTATLWPTPDDSGTLFLNFYQHFVGDRRRPPEALQQAQIEMIRSKGWRASPRYWAAYFVVSNR
jgi:CHAT domain-containing protein